jgi:O-antigen/teichoic acid export membrane protein
LGERVSSRTFIKNAIANVARGSTGALVSILVPALLARVITTELLGIWLLILQLSAYASYFDFGIQTTLGRLVAFYNEKGRFRYRNQIISTSAVLLLGASGLATLALVLLVINLREIFQEMPQGKLLEAQIALIVTGISTAIGLSASVFNGIAIGYQRYDIPAVIVSGSKILGGVLLSLAAITTGQLIPMAIAFSSINIFSYILLSQVSRKQFKGIELNPKYVSKAAALEILTNSASISVWWFSVLLISGLDTFLVGILDFQKVAHYAVATNLITFIAGLQNALFAALIPAAAVLDAQENRKELGQLLLKSTRYGTLVLLATGLPIILNAESILYYWLGADYAQKTTPILQILTVANIIRLTALPFVNLLLGIGLQKIVVITPIIEGLSNFLLSIVLGIKYGYIGVAAGTFGGSLMALIGNFTYNIPRAKSHLDVSLKKYFRECLLIPSMTISPLVLVFLIQEGIERIDNKFLITLNIFGYLISLLAILKFGLTSTERSTLYQKLALVKPFFENRI